MQKVRVVSPYFENSKNEDEERKKGKKLKRKGRNSKEVRVISPYFMSSNNEEETKKGKGLICKQPKRKKVRVVSPHFANLVSSEGVTWKGKQLKSEQLKSRVNTASASAGESYPCFDENSEIDGSLEGGMDSKVLTACSKTFEVNRSVDSAGQKRKQQNVKVVTSYSENSKADVEETKKGHNLIHKQPNTYEVQVVSPYFVNAVNNEEAKKKGEKLKSTQSHVDGATVRKTSPYFDIASGKGENAIAGSLEGGRDSKCLGASPKTSKVIKSILSAAQKWDEAYLRKTPGNTWKPPRSTFNLLQEDHAHDPWRVMIICMLLNRTTGLQAGRVISELFTLCPNAEVATVVDTKDIESIIQPLGLHRKRAIMIQRFSLEYLGEGWTHVTQLHGIGKYAADAYAIFCTGMWDRVIPSDHMLNKYWELLRGGCKPVVQ